MTFSGVWWYTHFFIWCVNRSCVYWSRFEFILRTNSESIRKVILNLIQDINAWKGAVTKQSVVLAMTWVQCHCQRSACTEHVEVQQSQCRKRQDCHAPAALAMTVLADVSLRTKWSNLNVAEDEIATRCGARNDGIASSLSFLAMTRVQSNCKDVSFGTLPTGWKILDLVRNDI